jgi:protein ImuB
VDKIGDLLQLSLTDIAKRFDIQLVTYVGRLVGQLKHPIHFYHPVEPFKQHLDLLFEVTQYLWLEKPLLNIYRLLEQFLTRCDKRAQSLAIELHLRDLDSQHICIAASQGEYKAKKWLELSLLTLSSLTLTAPVIAIIVGITQLIDNHFETGTLFSGKQADVSPQELVAMLQVKLGKHKVCGIEAIADHRPEKATQLCAPLMSKQSAPTFTDLRPSFLLPKPQRLTEKVQFQQGPERIVAGWWDNQPITRDYFIARSDSGSWLWVFRTPQQKWFVHGLFS